MEQVGPNLTDLEKANLLKIDELRPYLRFLQTSSKEGREEEFSEGFEELRKLEIKLSVWLINKNRKNFSPKRLDYFLSKANRSDKNIINIYSSLQGIKRENPHLLNEADFDINALVEKVKILAKSLGYVPKEKRLITKRSATKTPGSLFGGVDEIKSIDIYKIALDDFLSTLKEHKQDIAYPAKILEKIGTILGGIKNPGEDMRCIIDNVSRFALGIIKKDTTDVNFYYRYLSGVYSLRNETFIRELEEMTDKLYSYYRENMAKEILSREELSLVVSIEADCEQLKEIMDGLEKTEPDVCKIIQNFEEMVLLFIEETKKAIVSEEQLKELFNNVKKTYEKEAKFIYGRRRRVSKLCLSIIKSLNALEQKINKR